MRLSEEVDLFKGTVTTVPYGFYLYLLCQLREGQPQGVAPTVRCC